MALNQRVLLHLRVHHRINAYSNRPGQRGRDSKPNLEREDEERLDLVYGG